MSPEIWDLLHDGIIKEVKGTLSGDLDLTIEIEYIANKLLKNSNCIILKLQGCDLMELEHSIANETTRDIDTISNLNLWILTCEREGDHLLLYCRAWQSYDEGLLRMRYKSFEVFLENKSPISLNNMIRAADEYMDELGLGPS